MGFFSWVHRVRDADLATAVTDARRTVAAGLVAAREVAAAGPAAARTVRGRVGAVRRAAMSSAPSAGQDPAVPAPLSTARVRAWFSRQGYTAFVDDDGDVGGLWRGRLFYFFLFGDRDEILQVRGQWNREFALERLTGVLEICNAWNAEKIWPKAYVRVRDDGMVHVTCEVATDLEHGVSDDQLGQLLACGLSSANVFFDNLDELYPDPAAVAP